MSQPELLKFVTEALEALGIEYMAVGSMVSSVQGEPRSTHDIDLVIAIAPSLASQLVAAFPPSEFYFDLLSLREAIRSGGMVNLMDITGGDKVDFWMLPDSPYDKVCFSRRYVEDVVGIKVYVQRPEDTILSKLRWVKISGGSEKQFTDALRVYEVQHAKLDAEYLNKWAQELGVQSDWDRLKSEAELI